LSLDQPVVGFRLRRHPDDIGRGPVVDQAPLIIAPVAYKSGAVARLSNTMADTDLVFSKFESLCQSVGPARCALAGQSPVATRMNQLLAQLLRAPIPAPSATPRAS
jgi:hypothetical protein